MQGARVRDYAPDCVVWAAGVQIVWSVEEGAGSE